MTALLTEQGASTGGAPSRRRRTALLLLAPSVVLLIAVFLAAMQAVVVYSFQEYHPSGNDKGVITSWVKFLTDGFSYRIIGQTLFIGAVVTVITAVVGYLTAFALHHMKSRGWRNAGYAVVFSSFVFSGVASVYAWQLLLGQSGFLNAALGLVGLGPVQLLFESPAVVLALVYTLLPVMVLPIVSSLNQLDGSLSEASDDLGGTRWTTFRRITLPLTAPGLIAGCQLTFALAISSFAVPSLLGGGRVQMLANNVFDLVQVGDFPLASVAALVLIALALASAGIFIVVQRRFAHADRGGVTAAPPVPRGVRLLGVWMAFIWVFEILPAFLVVANSFSSVAYGVWPLPGLSLQWYESLLSQANVLPAFFASVEIALLVTVFAAALGTAASLALVRHRSRWSGSIQALLFSPVVVPKLAFGFALLVLLANLRLSGGQWTVVLAHTVAAIPFVIVLVTAALSRADQTLDEAAVDLGAGPTRAFAKSTLPQILPAIVISGLFSFLMSFNELELSLFLLSSADQTLPVWMFGYLRNYQDPTPAALASAMGIVSIVVVALMVLVLQLGARRRRSLS